MHGLSRRGLTGRGLTGRGLTGRGLTERGLTGRSLRGRSLTGRGRPGPAWAWLELFWNSCSVGPKAYFHGFLTTFCLTFTFLGFNFYERSRANDTLQLSLMLICL